MRCTASAFLAAAAAAALFGSSARGQNLFVNPSFETGDFTGWSLTGGLFYDGQHVAGLPDVNVRTGNYAAVGSSYGRLGISQTVPVQPGQVYEISGWGSLRGTGTAYASGWLTSSDQTGNAVSMSISAKAGTSASDFVRVRRLYQAPAGQTSATITLDAALGGAGSSWDDFAMTPWTGALTPVQDSQLIVAQGDTVPGGSDVIAGVWGAAINDAGQVLSLGLPKVTGNPQLLLVQRDTDGSQTVPARSGNPVVGGGNVGPVTTAFGGDGTLIGRIGLSPGGAITFHANQSSSNSADTLFRASQGQVSQVASVFASAPGGGYLWGFDHVVTADIGTAFEAPLSSGPTGGQGSNGIFYQPAGGALQEVVHDGDPAPDGGTLTLPPGVFPGGTRTFDMNVAGSIAFAASSSQGASGIYLETGGGRTLLPDSAGGGAPAINADDDVAFATGFVGPFSNIKLHRAGAASIALVASAGQSAPRGSAFERFGMPQLNDAAQVAFPATLQDGASAIFRAEPDGSIVDIARSTDAAPDGDGTFGILYSPGAQPYAPPLEPKLLAGGQVAFVAAMNRAPGEEGIYLADAKQVIPVTGWGHTIDGVAITKLLWENQQDLAANDSGQVAYAAELADGRSTSILFTPTLHWRSSASGNWSNSDNWTVGLAPAAVHPVMIDSPAGVSVTGPAGQTAIKSLTITSGNTLDLLAGSNITTSDGTTLDAGAFLRGSGTIAGPVTSAGTISPGDSAGKITIAGDYQQTGRLELQLFDGDSDQLQITNDALLNGEIDVSGSALPGQTFDLITIGGSLSGTSTWKLPGEGSSWRLLTEPGIGQVLQVTYLPEPDGAIPAAVGLLGLLIARRRRRAGRPQDSRGRRSGSSLRRESQHALVWPFSVTISQ